MFFDNYKNSMQGTYRGLIAFISLIVLDLYILISLGIYII